jgi:hypothetical protein
MPPGQRPSFGEIDMKMLRSLCAIIGSLCAIVETGLLAVLAFIVRLIAEPFQMREQGFAGGPTPSFRADTPFTSINRHEAGVKRISAARSI